MTSAVARFPFQGHPALSQLSFPLGAEIETKSETNKDGWIWGSYAGRSGWLPSSYIELVPLIPTASSYTTAVPQKGSGGGRQQEQQQRRTSSRAPSHQAKPAPTKSAPPPPPTTTTTIPVAPAPVASSNAKDDVNTAPCAVTSTSNDSNDDQAFPLMGGAPGGLFGGVTPIIKEEETVKEYHSFQQQQQQQIPAEPVDIYRHAPTKKRNYRSEYTPQISIQVTSKPSPPPCYGSRGNNAKISPQQTTTTTTDDFWKAHPGRAPGPTTADQAFELERAFDGIDDKETIEITVKKKSKFGCLVPKKFMKMAQKTFRGVKTTMQR